VHAIGFVGLSSAGRQRKRASKRRRAHSARKSPMFPPLAFPSVHGARLVAPSRTQALLSKSAALSVFQGVKLKRTSTLRTEVNQTVRMDSSTKDGVQSMWISFTDQRLTVHGGLAVWMRFVTEVALREQLTGVLPHAPNTSNAYDPVDTTWVLSAGSCAGRTSPSGMTSRGAISASPLCYGLEFRKSLTVWHADVDVSCHSRGCWETSPPRTRRDRRRISPTSFSHPLIQWRHGITPQRCMRS
jgi:hypothetical protein